MNKVQLLGWYGGDSVACISAWQSTTEELGIELPENISDRVDTIFKTLSAGKKKSPEDLLLFLAQHGHETPFEKATLHFQIKADVASHIHALKHRMSSINAESFRYKEAIADKHFVPDDWTPEWQNKLVEHSQQSFELYHQAIEELAPLVGRKRAKESARFFLPYSVQINFDWMMNFRSFVNIQHLRNSDDAQREIHMITNTMLYLVENIPGKPFRHSLEAFGLKSNDKFLLESLTTFKEKQT
jgi:flavin-dependent thymidylate synthase